MLVDLINLMSPLLLNFSYIQIETWQLWGLIEDASVLPCVIFPYQTSVVSAFPDLSHHFEYSLMYSDRNDGLNYESVSSFNNPELSCKSPIFICIGTRVKKHLTFFESFCFFRSDQNLYTPHWPVITVSQQLVESSFWVLMRRPGAES